MTDSNELITSDEERIKLLEQANILEEYKRKDISEQINKALAQIEVLKQRQLNAFHTIENNKRKIETTKEKIKNDIINAKLQAEDTFLSELAEEIRSLTLDFPAIQKARSYQYDDIMATVAAYKNYPKYSGMLNANDMGAGKTAEATMCLYIFTKMFQKEHNRFPNILWLTKKSLVLSSPNEIRRWWPDVKIAVPPENSSPQIRAFALEVYEQVHGIFLTNYEFVRTTPSVRNTQWDFLVVDEVHKLKGGANDSGPTAIWTAVKDLAQETRFKMFLTGTPMVNDPQEMYSYLHIFAPDRFPSLKAFKNSFCDYKTMSGVVQLAVDPIKILNQALKGQMIRRSRSEFGIELPELTIETIELQMGEKQRELYNQLKTRFFVWLDSQEENALTATAIIAQLIRLRQMSVWPAGISVTLAPTDGDHRPVTLDGELLTIKKALDCKESIKIDEAMDRIEMVTSLLSQVDESITEQIVVGCTFNEPLREIQRRCDALKITCEIISGEVTSREKNRNLEQEFQQGKVQVLCINTAMGEGLNLQKNPSNWIGGASYEIILDNWWNSSRQDQFIGRVHRQGGTFPVTVWKFHNEHSIDDYIQAKNDEKDERIGNIMDSDIIRPQNWKNYLEKLL